MPFAAPNSVIIALNPYSFSQAVRGARYVDAREEHWRCPPEKSESRYSWISNAGFVSRWSDIGKVRSIPVLLRGSFSLYNQSLDGSSPCELVVQA